ncbi:MAG TPA: hypothetical protein VGV69_08865 [Solirubrobacterales bacterium]|nr:hypothetical protein [Solirubrobacterales bacterium]
MAGEQQSESKRYKVLSAVLGAVIVLFLVFQVFDLRIAGGDESELTGPNFPPGGPAEFLYLDANRVAAYLAQVNGGTFDAEKVTRKLSGSQSAKLTVPGGGEGGVSQSQETAVEREVKPTEASNFFALRSGLLEAGELHEIGLRYFEKDVERLEQGAFVTFKTTALLSPQYLNAYLAVREDNTIAALFPDNPKRRKAAKNFFELVGQEPRVVFALQPEKEAGGGETNPFVYLLPMNAGRLTAERSLLKYGGGRFTVVGKLVRTFPEKNRERVPAYIDSATRETWEQPLRRGAPRELLCRTDPRCIALVREEKLTGAPRGVVAESARTGALEALAEQTEIQSRGAVILPVAIYK